MFIAFDGIDAAGKHTQTERLQLRLERLGREVVIFSFPQYKGALGELIRAHLHGDCAVMRPSATGSGYFLPAAFENRMAFECVLLMDRYLSAPTITAALGRGAVVLVDRWWASSDCYGRAWGLPADFLRQAIMQLPQPDLSLFIDVTPEEAMVRRPKLRDRNEQDRGLQDRVRANYKELWGQPLPGTWRVIDGMGSREEVEDRIWQRVVQQQERSMRR